MESPMASVPVRDLMRRLGASVRGVPRLTRVAVFTMLTLLAALIVRAEVRRIGVPDGVEITTGIAYRRVGLRRATLDIYRPSVRPEKRIGRGLPAIVAIHGGAWSGGSRISYGREI